MSVLLNWNIKHGGGKRIDAIADAINSVGADMVVLTEFRDNSIGSVLQKGLETQGLVHQCCGKASMRQNTILIAAKEPFEAATFERQLGDNAHRCLRAAFSDFNLFGFYFPNGHAKRPVFDFIAELPRSFLDNPTMLVGDFNTGKHFVDEQCNTFIEANSFCTLEYLGWIDAWRHFNGAKREFSWFSNAGNGFRIDHVFASRSMLLRFLSVRYSHEHRALGLSDHSALLLEFEREKAPGAAGRDINARI